MKSCLARPVPFVLTALLLFAPATAHAQVTTYSSLGAFLEALGATPTLQNFDGFDAGTPINDQISGLVFSSPNVSTAGYLEIQTDASDAAVSSPNMLIGGSVPGITSQIVQVINIDFSPSLRAVAFYVTAYDPAATAGSIRLVFDNETSTSFDLLNTGASELTPIFFGAISTQPFFRVAITSGFEGGAFEEFGIDDLRYLRGAVRDVNPPVCLAQPRTEEGTAGIDGTASDTGELESGIQSVVLGEGATNLSLVVTPFDAGASSVTFRVTPTNPALAGQGLVVATDGGGNRCTVTASFRAFGPGPIENQTICEDQGLVLDVSNASSTPAGTGACSADDPGAGEPSFPPGYIPTPAGDTSPCRIFTIESPLSGDTEMVLTKDGDFLPSLRLLFSHSQTVGGVLVYPPFSDITQFVEQINPLTIDPTRVKGSAEWSPVKVTCAIQSEGARVDFCAGLPSGSTGPDADHDGFNLCAASSFQVDCNDQNNDIFPGAGEVCNGLDDDCDGQTDEGNPPGIPCPVPGLLGACRQGETSCSTLPLVCRQTVFPKTEIACNGIDDDCDGHNDEAYDFSGYLAPIKADGSTVFIKKRGAIPVKFELRDCSGKIVPNAVARIEVHFVMNGQVGDDPIDIGSIGQANTGNLYRFDPNLGQYIYNLNAAILQSNSVYVIRTLLDDGTTHDVTISIK